MLVTPSHALDQHLHYQTQAHSLILSYKYRIKDKNSAKHLDAYARACNYVWNYCCEVQRKAEAKWKSGAQVRWPTHFDLVGLTTGVSKELKIRSDTIGQICKTFVIARNSSRRIPKFRSSSGSRKSLGWVPFGGRDFHVRGDYVAYLGRTFRFWKSRELGGEFKTGCFTQDSHGHWYIVFQCEVEAQEAGAGQVGIDLGLKTMATCSDGTSVPALQHYRKYADALGKAQRAGNKKRVRAIHAKIANSRKHHLHVASTRIARENKLIVVGDVSSSKLAKTKMAKSVLDAGWFMFKEMLRYKSARRQATFLEVNEAYTSQTCSTCGCLPQSRPRGIAGLGIRHWTCDDCGEVHDRDLNAAKNILRVALERQRPVEEIRADIAETLNTETRQGNRV